MTTSQLTVAAIQMKATPFTKETNLQKAEQLIEQAARQHASLIVLPELFSTGYAVAVQDQALSEPIPGPTTTRLHTICQRFNITVAGGIIEQSSVAGVLYNTTVVISPEGVTGKYRKTYLWGDEKNRFRAGTHTQPLLEAASLKLGTQICYEIGFPEPARALTTAGIDLLLVNAAFSQKRIYAWDIATRARALENGLFVIGSNQAGTDDFSAFGGQSRIVNPQGQVVVEATAEDQAIVTEIDLSETPLQRQDLPYLRDLK
ncbi:carbon-nitrogen hydrolase family protein [Salsuginibacillus kocurii]|uniref:carbon-nitrogen hydrolase family protein n=1 Tax=Salsuginibacillus kocurii TaxID=427078 RepID=UPI0003621949|nr:carbon-nitrogen hydrolase family protein [Salsuginibacillus kocurii]